MEMQQNRINKPFPFQFACWILIVIIGLWNQTHLHLFSLLKYFWKRRISHDSQPLLHLSDLNSPRFLLPLLLVVKAGTTNKQLYLLFRLQRKIKLMGRIESNQEKEQLWLMQHSSIHRMDALKIVAANPSKEETLHLLKSWINILIKHSNSDYCLSWCSCLVNRMKRVAKIG